MPGGPESGHAESAPADSGHVCAPRRTDGGHTVLPGGRQAPTLTVKRRGFPSCAAPETSGSPSGRTSSYGNA